MLRFLWMLCFCVIGHRVFGDVQTFASVPENAEVTQGQTSVLHCHVSNLAGAVQWSKDGVLLGFDPSIPGFDRYSMVGDLTQGIYNLKIENVQLEDEGDFECQVGPSGGQAAISAKGHLTVLLPPTAISIADRANGSRIDIMQSKSLSLTCKVEGGKPAAAIRWFRNSVSLGEDVGENSIENETGGRQTAKSKLDLRPSAEDNNARYVCTASGASSTDSLQAGVTLNVLYPPGRPQIDGYTTSDKIRAGDTVRLRCTSRGGNPLAQLTWTKDGASIDHSYVTSDGQSLNEIPIEAGPADDGAVYACASSSVVSPEPVVVSVTLSVLYSPSAVSISCPKEAKSGDVFVASCKTDRSNPAAEISWVVDGRPVRSRNVVEVQERGGWVTTSEIDVNVTRQDRNVKLLSCYAVNQLLGETKVETATISILYAPDPPSIFGYLEGNAIKAGAVQRMTCVSHGGNPLPELKWHKGTEELASSSLPSTGNVVSAELTIIAEARDNGAEYLCKSSSKAMQEPLVATVTLTVYFPPAVLTLKVKQKKPKAGSKGTLICNCSSSNPAATLSWWSGGVQLPPTANATSTIAEHGGFSSRLVHSLDLTAGDDGSTYTCRATNEATEQSVHDAIVLRVFYKPTFSGAGPFVFEVKQGETLLMDMSATANPPDIAYQWTRGNDTKWDTAVVNVSSVEQADTGTYSCQASNEVGASKAVVDVKVLFPAAIVKPKGNQSHFITADVGSDPRLDCRADGYPLPDSVITWKRDGFALAERTETVSKTDGRSVLVVKNASREDSGEFVCVADNGVGAADTWTVTLLVKHQPVMVGVDKHSPVFSDRDVSATLRCRAEGVPDVGFGWTFEGVRVSEGNARMSGQVHRVDHVTWEGTLTINQVVAKDFGEYQCTARNNVSFASARVTLMPDSAPDPPLAVKVVNATRTALLVAWSPGFDGGHNQTYRVRFRSGADPTSHYVDVHPPSANMTWIEGLRSASEYQFAAMASNSKGNSLYTTDIVKARTLADPSEELKPDVEDEDDLSLGGSLIRLLVSTISTVFVLLLVFNIVLLAIYYKKRAPSIQKKYESDWSSSSDVSSSIDNSQETSLSTFSDATRKEISSPTSREDTSFFETYSSPEITDDSFESAIDSESESFDADRPIGAFV